MTWHTEISVLTYSSFVFRVENLEEQAEKCLRNVRRFSDPLDQYVYMVDLLNRNERLFYKLLSENVMELMPIVYTPTVGLACQKFGFTFKQPQGRYYKSITLILRAQLFETLVRELFET